MKKKIGFIAAMTLVALALLSTRFYMVDVPIWHFLGGGKGPDPATLHLRGAFVESMGAGKLRLCLPLTLIQSPSAG